MVGKFSGILVGYRKFDKAVEVNGQKMSKERHTYDVFCTGGRKDPKTGLFTDECKVVSITEDEQVLSKMEYGMAVEFYGEAAQFKDKSGNMQSYLRYSGIEAVGK